MTEPYIVEVWGKPVGVVTKDGNAFRFHAMAQPYFALDGVQFTKLGHARLAAARLDFDQARHDEARDLSPELSPVRSLGSASHWAASPAARPAASTPPVTPSQVLPGLTAGASFVRPSKRPDA